jgi:hypothetical protein
MAGSGSVVAAARLVFAFTAPTLAAAGRVAQETQSVQSLL